MNPTPKFSIGQVVLYIRPKHSCMKHIGRIKSISFDEKEILYRITGCTQKIEEGYIGTNLAELRENFLTEILPDITSDYAKRFKEGAYTYDTSIPKSELQLLFTE